MSAIVIDKQLVHYEVLGRGRPIIFLHSWLGSWRGWMPTMEAVSDRFRPMALDFWGFGDSAPQRDAITLDRYVEQLNGFVQTLGIVGPHVVGHGLGGMVAVRAACQQPASYGKVLTVGTPITGAQLRPPGGGLQRLLGRGNNNNDAWLKLVRQAASQASTDEGFDEIAEDIEMTDPDVVNAVLQAIGSADLRADITRLECPLLAIHGGRDTIVPPSQASLIDDAEGRFRQVLMFEKSGHFPQLDEPNQFTRAIKQFFGDSDKVVELKTEWKRRVSQREFL